MIQSITHHKISAAIPVQATQIEIDPNFENLSFQEKLQHIGLINDRFKVLFPLSEIPDVSEESQRRFDELMEREVHFCSKEGEIIKSSNHDDYISDWKTELLNRGFKTRNYLRGGYAAYVADLHYRLEFLIVKFLAFKNLPLDLLSTDIEALKKRKEHAPDDVDLFDYVINDGIPSTCFPPYYIDFLKTKMQNGDHTKIQLLQLLAPEKTTDLFPYPANYMLVTVGNPKEKLQTDRITGKLHHLYLFTRDDISIEIIDGKMCIPQSAGDFSQMLIDRIFKVVRTEPRHQLDFRAGLATLQLVHDDHILIEDECSLQSILDYALKIDDERIFTGATDRAELHCNSPKGFLLSVLAAYSITAVIPEKYLQILTKAIGEFPPLPSLYKYALLLTRYKDKTDSAEWDPSGFLILNWNNNRIVFPKNFAITSTEPPFFASKMGSWQRCSSSAQDPVYKVLEGELSPLEGVLFNLAVQKSLMLPFIKSLVEYLIQVDDSDELISILHLMPKEFHNAHKRANNMGWIKLIMKYSPSQGIKLWNASKVKMSDAARHKAFEEIMLLIAQERPKQTYDLLNQESIPKELRIKLLKKIVESPYLNPQTSIHIIEEFLMEPGMEASITRALESIPLRDSFQQWKIPEFSASYIKYIKQFQLAQLAKKWIESFPQSERMNQIQLLLTPYNPKNHPLLKAISTLPDLTEIELLEAFYLQGHPVFDERPVSNLMTLLGQSFSDDHKMVILSTIMEAPPSNKEMVIVKNWMKTNPSISLKYIAALDNLQATIQHLIHLKTAKKPADEESLFVDLWKKTLDRSLLNPETLHLLIPFYNNRKWVKSVYGVHAVAETRKWAKNLIKQDKLNESDIAAINKILSQTKLQYTPRVMLKHYLQSIQNEDETNDDEIPVRLFGEIVNLLRLIENDTKERRQHFEILINLFKLGVAAKSLLNVGLPLIKQAFANAPLFVSDKSFDPILELLQSMPLVNQRTEKLYNEWNDTRNELYLEWQEVQISKTLLVKDIKDNKPLKILPYDLVLESLKYAHLFKLITEQYIEGKVSEKDFQDEICELAISASLTFKSQKLMPHEDPLLTCIYDFSHLLKDTNKRVRAYESFHFMLDIWKLKRIDDFQHIDDKKKYLTARKMFEDLILFRMNDLVKNKGFYSTCMNLIQKSMTTYLQSSVIPNLHTQDPILDSLELDSIQPMIKVDLLRILSIELESIPSPPYEYHAKRVVSLLEWEHARLQESDIIQFFNQQIEQLKIAKGTKDNKSLEGVMLFQAAGLLLSDDKTNKIRLDIEKALRVKLPIMVFNLQPPTKPEDNKFDVNSGVLDLANSVNQSDKPQYHAFYSAVTLVSELIEQKFMTSNYFSYVRLMQTKAPLYLVEYNGVIVFDPIVYFLQTSTLFDPGSENAFNEFNNQKLEFFQLWIDQLKSSDNQKHALYAKECTSLEILPYETVKTSSTYVKEIHSVLKQFVSQEIEQKAFEEKIRTLLDLTSEVTTGIELNRFNDPCYKAAKTLLPFFKKTEIRERAYSAFNYVHEQWTISRKLPYFDTYRSFLHTRKSTEDLILEQLDLFKTDKSVYSNLFKALTEYFPKILKSNILQTCPILDPVADALLLDTISPTEKIKIMYYWVNGLKNVKAPMATIQMDVLSEFIKQSSKSVTEAESEQFLYTRMEKLIKAKHLIDKSIFDSEKLSINAATSVLSSSKAQAIKKKLNMIKK